jgi:D-glycero-D-manno-heptose 1,7-bisphosphate phosphatase
MPPQPPTRPAVFLDRDGTIIREVHYIRHPSQVELIPGAAGAIASLQNAGLLCVVVSNQAGVGRGILTLEDVKIVQREVDRQLLADGVKLDGFYFCPEAPRSNDRRSVDHPDRKPGPGMLLRAAADHGIDLARSWMVGDMLSDVLAGRNAGVFRTIHVLTGHGHANPEASVEADHVASDIVEAAGLIVRYATKLL